MLTNKKAILFISCVMFGLVMLLGADPAREADRERYEEKFEQSVSLARDGRVILRNISGDIEVNRRSPVGVRQGFRSLEWRIQCRGRPPSRRGRLSIHRKVSLCCSPLDCLKAGNS